MSTQPRTSGDAMQARVIAFLAEPATYANTSQVERFDTHGNVVFLAGAEAWKIKRAVRFPYMDFSTLEKRHAACLREVEINRRFSRDLYLGCVPITRRADGTMALDGEGEPIEWAVRMRRFEQSALLSSIAEKGPVGDELAKQLADVVFEAHANAERASPRSGAPPFHDLLASVCAALGRLDGADREDVDRLTKGMETQLDKAAATLDERARGGFVRRCHGDMHLANIVMWEGRPALYDAIEFDEAIATIDTLYDLAFLLMDLDRYGQRRAANVVLNRYLWRSQDDLDLAGLAALPLFLALRAAIRAMVTLERAAQEGPQKRARDVELARRYLNAALEHVSPPAPRLLVVGGLSGTGKTTLAASLAPLVGGAPGAVHLRSDLERKAAAGVDALDRLPAESYTQEANQLVYRRLEEKARAALDAGRSVVVDAVYARTAERDGIEALAARHHVPFQALWLAADSDTLTTRVTARRNDASDATADVVAQQSAYELGPMSAAWLAIDAAGRAEETLRAATSRLGLTRGEAP